MSAKQQDKGTWIRAGSLMPSPSPSKVNQAQAASPMKAEDKSCVEQKHDVATLSGAVGGAAAAQEGVHNDLDPWYKCYLGKQLRKATTERWRNPMKMCDTKFKMKHCYSISKMFLVQMALIL